MNLATNFLTSLDSSPHNVIEALILREQELRRLLDAIPHIAWATRNDTGELIYINDRWRAYTGEEDADVRRVFTRIHPDDRKMVRSRVAESRRTGEVEPYEIRLRGKDRRYRWFRVMPSVLRRDDGTIESWIGTSTDVNEEVLARDAERKSEALFRTTFENAAVGIAHVGLDGQWLRVNDRLTEIVGYTKNELLGLTFGDITHPDDLEADWAKVRQLVAGEIDSYSMEKRYICKNRKQKWVNLTVALVRDEKGKPQFFVSVVEDIQARKEAEKALRDSEAALRSFYECSPLLIGIVEIPEDNSEIYHLYDSPATERLFGLKRGQTAGKAASKLGSPPDVLKEWIKQYRESQARNGPVQFEYAHPGASGPVWLSTTVLCLGPAARGRTRFCYVSEDVTDRKAGDIERESSRQELERLNRSLAAQAELLELAHDAIFVQKWDGTITFWNRSAERMYGWPREEAIGENVHKLLDSQGVIPIPEILKHVEKTGYWEGDIVHTCRDGSKLTVSSKFALRETDGEREILEIARDVTEERKATARLEASERRQRVLLRISDQTKELSDPGHLITETCRIISEELGIARCGYSAIHEDEGWFEIEYDYSQGVPTAVGRYDMGTIPLTLREKYRRGETLVIADVRHDPLTKSFWKGIFKHIQVISSMSVPLVRAGKWVANFAVHHDKARHWTDEEIRLLEEAAPRIFDAVDRARAEQEIKHREAQYRALAESVPIIVWTANPAGELTFVNDRWKAYFGGGRGPTSPIPWLGFVHPDDGPAVAEEWNRCVKAKTPCSVECRMRAAIGTYRWHVVVAHPEIRGDEIAGWVGGMVDVHEQRSREAVQDLLVRIADKTQFLRDPAEIVQTILDLLGSYLGVARCAYAEVDEDEDGVEVIANHVSKVPDMRGRYRLSDFGPLGGEMRAGVTVTVDDVRTWVRNKDLASAFEAIYVRSFICTPLLKDGRLTVLFAVHDALPRDWTPEEVGLVKMVADRCWSTIERARAERALQRANLELEERVVERTADLQSANERMETFTYHVSHDLRAPLRAIMATSRIVQQDFGEKLPPEAHAELERQAQAAKSLGNLIDDLLKLSRLAREEIQRAQVDLTALARSIVGEVVSQHAEMAVRIEVEEGLGGEADPRLLKLAIQNLIDNAIKYSPEGGTIRVGRRPDGFFVSDEGIGIDAQYLEKIFEPFQRLHRDDEFAGTGIGLANVKQVIERHGGQVWAESEPGRGTTFYFTLG
jgi:PAS domain S-box-containing protein